MIQGLFLFTEFTSLTRMLLSSNVASSIVVSSVLHSPTCYSSVFSDPFIDSSSLKFNSKNPPWFLQSFVLTSLQASTVPAQGGRHGESYLCNITYHQVFLHFQYPSHKHQPSHIFLACFSQFFLETWVLNKIKLNLGPFYTHSFTPFSFALETNIYLTTFKIFGLVKIFHGKHWEKSDLRAKTQQKNR